MPLKTCPYCNSSISVTNKYNLRAHIEAHHPIEAERMYSRQASTVQPKVFATERVCIEKLANALSNGVERSSLPSLYPHVPLCVETPQPLPSSSQDRRVIDTAIIPSVIVANHLSSLRITIRDPKFQFIPVIPEADIIEFVSKYTHRI